MKNKGKASLLVLFAIFCVVVLSCASTDAAVKADAGPPVPTLATGEWEAYTDIEDGGSSTATMVTAQEVIDGNTVTTYRVTGNITTKFEYGFAGWTLNVDDATLKLLKTARSFSFWILGDGQRYTVQYKTSNIKDYAYYEYSFNTKKGEAQYIEIPMSSFKQASWGKSVKLDQSLAEGVEWQTHEVWRKSPTTNPFDIKIWGFTVYN